MAGHQSQMALALGRHEGYQRVSEPPGSQSDLHVAKERYIMLGKYTIPSQGGGYDQKKLVRPRVK